MKNRVRARASVLTVASLLAAGALGGVSSLGAGGCGEGGTVDSRLPTMGTPGLPSPAVIGANLVFAQVLLNGVGGGMLIDTGAPYTYVDPAQFPGARLPAMGLANASLTFGGRPTDFTVDQVPIYSDSADPLPFGGIVGGNLLRQFAVSFNYRDQNLLLAGMAMPADVEEPGVSIPFKLEGAGFGRLSMKDTAVTSIPATRVPIAVDIEGTPHPFILDTGASDVIARTSLYDALVADGRPQLAGATISTVYGTITGTLSRTRAINLGGQAVANSVLLKIGDELLDALAQEVGHPVDGLLGGCFLRNFLVTVDYPHGVLRLQRYGPTSTPVPDQLRRIGIAVTVNRSGPHLYVVAMVYPGSDAERQGVMVNDELVSIGGVALDALDAFAVERLLQGPVGETRPVEFGMTSSAGNLRATLALRIDDLLPDPS